MGAPITEPKGPDMTLEKAIADLTEAVEQNTKTIQKLVEIGKGGKGEAPASRRAAKDKDAEPDDKPRRGRRQKDERISPDDFRKRFGDFLAREEDDEDATDDLIDCCTPICDHFGVKKITEIDEDDYEEALGYLDLLEAGYKKSGVKGAKKVDLDLGNEGRDNSIM